MQVNVVHCDYLRAARTVPRRTERTNCNEYQRHTSTPQPMACNEPGGTFRMEFQPSYSTACKAPLSLVPFSAPLHGRTVPACSCWPQTRTPRFKVQHPAWLLGCASITQVLYLVITLETLANQIGHWTSPLISPCLLLVPFMLLKTRYFPSSSDKLPFVCQLLRKWKRCEWCCFDPLEFLHYKRIIKTFNRLTDRDILRDHT